jgi:hypothetical protein
LTVPKLLFDVKVTLPSGQRITMFDVQAVSATHAELLTRSKHPIAFRSAKLTAVRPRFAVVTRKLVGFGGNVRWQETVLR